MIEFLNSMIHFAFWAVLFVLALQHLLGPYLVWKNERVPATYEFPPQDVNAFLSQQMPAVREAVAELGTLGFAPAAVSVLEKTNAKSFFLVFQHSTEPTSAMLVIASWAKGSFFYTEFTQRFTDNTVLDVMNSPMPSLFPVDEAKQVYRFPGMRITELFDGFKKLRGHLLPHKTPIRSLGIGSELTDLARWMDLEAASLIERGYYRQTANGNENCLTLKGACLFTWKLAWPWKPLRNYFELARARRALATS
jgi:hypothetical protein